MHLYRLIIHRNEVVLYQRSEQSNLRLHLVGSGFAVGTQAQANRAILGQISKVYALGERVLPRLDTQRQPRLRDTADEQRAVDNAPMVSIVGRNIRQNLLLHSNLHLVWHARHRGKNLAILAENHQWGATYPIRQNLSRLRHLPLGSGQSVEHIGTVFVEVLNMFAHARILHQVGVEILAKDMLRDVVLRRTEPARGEYDIRTAESIV